MQFNFKFSLSFHFCLLYLLLNSCNGNDATPATKQRFIDTLGSISQNVLNEAVGLEKQLCAWVKVKGDHFERLLK